MIMEMILLLEAIAFIFLALGIMPFRKSEDAGNLPLANKVIFIVISGTLFFVLAILAANYSYTHCYINETISDPVSYTTVSTAVCESHIIENLSLSYINTSLGILAIFLGLIIMIVALVSRNDRHYPDEDM